ncbi:hypothetical protein GGR56DRAFT_663877 [Xylariaceae sp. FL0804]|nr:hypothetical protein GGR56DRAFT_663877 [Xylariaceae sp. FL0804]
MSTPSFMALVVSPDGPGTNTRTVTPDAQSSSAKRILILTTHSEKPSNVSPGTRKSTRPFFGVNNLFPSGECVVAQEYAHAHPTAENEEAVTGFDWNIRYVLLPYDLRDRNISITEGEASLVLYNIFPDTENIAKSTHRSHLTFNSGSCLVDRGCAILLSFTPLGDMHISICQDYDIDQMPDMTLRKLAEDVYMAFSRDLPGIRFVELILTCERTFVVVLEDEVKDYQWSHKRQLQPDVPLGIVHDTAYETLRPRVIVCSIFREEHAHPAEFRTTSGVLVENSHEGGAIYHPGHRDEKIGQASVEILFTDITLVKLEKGGCLVPQRSAKPSRRPPETWPSSSGCYMNSPFDGAMFGVIVDRSVRLQTSLHQFHDVVYKWTWCIDKGPYQGFCAPVSARELPQAGWQLVRYPASLDVRFPSDDNV